VVFGLTVEDLSEKGGAFLGVDGLTHHAPVYPGDTLTSASEVTAMRESRSHPGHGVVTWWTEGLNQHGVRVVDFQRTNLIVRRPPGGGA
jgi:acyl dehydratase